MKSKIGEMPKGAVIEATVRVPCSVLMVKFQLTGEPCGGYIRRARVLSPTSFADQVRSVRRWVQYLGLDRDQSVFLPVLGGRAEVYVDMLGPDRPTVFSLSGEAELFRTTEVLDE